MNISFKLVNNKLIRSIIYDEEFEFRQYNFYKSITLNGIRYITNPIDEILISQREIEFLTNEHICFIEKYYKPYQHLPITSPVILLELTPTALLKIL